MIRVLFVCLGNICRSPMAEAIFLHKVKLANLGSEIEADSAGTGDWHIGEAPHRETQQILADNAIAYDHKARQIAACDLGLFDYIITMDEANRRGVSGLGAGPAKVASLLDYAPHVGLAEVPDPYYTGNFEEVYHLVSEATDGLLASIRREHDL